ncbi:uncharacterized protein LOC120331031 isoform X3 [Styela clava]
MAWTKYWMYHEKARLLLVLSLVSCALAGDPPSFIETPPPTKISRQGDSLLLKCRATGRPKPFISWRKDGRLVTDGQDGIRLSGGDLAVTSLTTSHRGRFTCRAQSVEGQIQFATTVKVEAPPEFEKTPSDLTTEEGKDAMFDCSATGYPTVMKYSWTFNGVPVQRSETLRGRSSILPDGSLIIYNISTKDKGNVTCTVDNDFGVTPTATASLFVQFQARVTNMPAIVYAGLGLKAILHCPSEAEPPVNKVIWKKDSYRISPQQDPRISMDGDGTLTIDSASLRDAGRYTCTPYNIRGTLGESTGTVLRIRDPPYFTYTPRSTYEAEIGKTITIPCKGGGDPPPAVSWRKVLREGDSVHYKVDFGTLTIKPVTKAIHGTWQCVLTNSVAEVKQNVEIRVKYTSPHKVQNVTVRAVSDASVKVSWIPGYNGGHPQRFMVWYKPIENLDPSWQTYHVGGNRNVAILENLLPNTVYEIAVLPENKIRSGPFSDTVTIKTKDIVLPANSNTVLLSPPTSLFASTTNDDLVQLSWRKPTIYRQKDKREASHTSVWFLLEYRWTGVDNGKVERNLSKSNSDVTVYDVTSRKKRSITSTKIPLKNKWESLTMTYDNITRVVLKPNQLYRDILYDFRILTVQGDVYSPPSSPVSISTKGLNAYPCYTGIIQTAAFIAHPILFGVLAAIILVILFIVIAIIWFCKRRRNRKKKPKSGEESTSQENTSNHISHTKPTMNGRPGNTNHQPTVVDLTNNGMYGNTGNRNEFESTSTDDDVKTPFINEIDEESEKIFSDFIQRQRQNDIESRTETRSSGRSSVRIRRETAARVLLAQYKRRSFTDYMHHRVHRELPLRGGTRSASTSPERNNVITRPDNLNITAPADIDGPQTSRKRFRLYSRPIDDGPGSTQQRRMIVIKRKSQKSSSSEQLRTVSNGAPPSDSSESPVFGVVGTIKHRSSDSLDRTGPKTSSPIRRQWNSSYRQRSFNRSQFENNDEYTSCDVMNNNNKTDDVINRGGDRPIWTSPTSDPIYASSPNDSQSPDVSPNRVIARKNVQYDPLTDPISPVSYSGSPTRHHDIRSFDDRQKSKSLTHEQARMLNPARNRSESARHHVHPHRKIGRPPFEGIHHNYQHPSPNQYPQYGPSRTRYSLSPHPQTLHSGIQHHPGHFNPLPSSNNLSRSRASYTYGHHQPLSLFSPTQGFEQPHPQIHTHTPHSTHPISPQPDADRHQPQSTCEIDCSNSDIEVRFVKDPNGNECIPVTSVSSGELMSPSTRLKSPPTVATNAGSTTTPSSGNSALDLRYNLRNMSTSDSAKGGLTTRKLSPTRKTNTVVSQDQEHRTFTPRHQPHTVTKPRPRHLLSPTGTKSGSPFRHVKLRSDGDSDPPTSPPLALGSSDYGSQDTSNSSTSPIAHSNTNNHNATSPLHLRFPGLANERPPRRDNSSVEDNYEWDSEIAMESEILEALRHFGTLKKSGPVSDELLDELNKITKDRSNIPHQRQRAHSADILENTTREESLHEVQQPPTAGPSYSKESMARRCAALRAEFLHYQQLQQLDEDG